MLIKGDNSLSSFYGSRLVEGKACINLSWNITLDLLEYLHTEGNAEMIVDKLNDLCPFLFIQGSPLNWLSFHLLFRSRMGPAKACEEFKSELYRVKKYSLEVWLLSNLKNQGRVSCWILWLILLNEIEISGISDYKTVALKLFKLTLINFDLLPGLLALNDLHWLLHSDIIKITNKSNKSVMIKLPI